MIAKPFPVPTRAGNLIFQLMGGDFHAVSWLGQLGFAERKPDEDGEAEG